MEWVEITAKTVEAAKERALDELGIADDEAEFVVVEEPRRGLFKQVRGTARVRARVAPRTPRAKGDRRGKRTRGSGGTRDAEKQKDSSRSSQKRENHQDGTTADKQDVAPDRVAESKKSPKPKKASKSKKPAKSSTAAKTGDADKSSKSSKSAKEEGTTMSMTLDEQVVATEAFLTGLLEAIGFEGRIVTERVDDANAQVNIEGEDLGLLIGPRGQTMNAIQDLTRITLQKQAAGSWEGHVHVDVNGYRAKRREALVSFVAKVADDVLSSGNAKALEPMAASDRKVVHDTVNEIDGVTTSSEGHEPRRWVKISPDND